MTESHASERLLARYAAGDRLPGDGLWAIEAHLESCAECRGRLARHVGERSPELSALVADVWSGLETRLAATAPAPPRRRWVRWSAAWVAPALPAWIVMTVLVTLLGVLFDLLRPDSAAEVSLVLLVAPVLPVLGVAASWGRGTDPAYEITAATPRAGLQLVFRRTAAVLVVVIPVLLAAGWATGMTPWLWLLPCLAFTTGTLALGRALGMFRAVASLIAVWAGVIVAPTLAQDRVSFALRPEALPVWAAICVLGLAVVVLRRADFTLLTTRP